MEKQKISTGRVLKFAIPSLLGAALFLIPMKVNGEFVLGVSILCDLIQGWMTPVVDALSLLFLGVAALLPFVAKIAKPGFILNQQDHAQPVRREPAHHRGARHRLRLCGVLPVPGGA